MGLSLHHNRENGSLASQKCRDLTLEFFTSPGKLLLEQCNMKIAHAKLISEIFEPPTKKYSQQFVPCTLMTNLTIIKSRYYFSKIIKISKYNKNDK